MIGECHAHIAMDGVNYARAMARHEKRPDEAHIRACFEVYRENGVDFVRDGGDAYGVSRRAVSIAPEYGIDYRTPIFAIHKVGHYGSIVGKAFSDLHEYAFLVDEAERQGADFIKIMTTGIMDFNEFGRITHADLPAAEVREMVHIAHEQGFAVMSHTNGKQAVLDAVEAGVDSIEHGNYIDDECIAALAETHTCFVPTATVARNLIGCGLFDDDVLARIWEASRSAIAAAIEAGCLVALGSDAGAVGVPHGIGAHDEHRCFADAVSDPDVLRERLAEGDLFIRSTFKRGGRNSS
jgi:predicted amidohydrolase YtcJ